MDVSVGERWERFVAEVVIEGRFGSASEVISEGLRLLEEREQKIKALRTTLEESVTRGGNHTSEEAMEAVLRRAEEWAAKGY